MPGVEEVEQARLALFTDVGQVYDDSFEMEELRYSTGLGLIWMTPIGPLSFVYSAALNAKSEDETESFQFSIGSSF
jgi:outer membrane protein insertion porin family